MNCLFLTKGNLEDCSTEGVVVTRRESYTHEGVKETTPDEIPAETGGRSHGVLGGKPQHDVRENPKGRGEHDPAGTEVE